MKNTKRALLLSALAIVMSVAMLIGSTFAWFTDSASTAVNTIQSGTLKVELEYQKADGSWADAEGLTLNWVTADGRTDNILWEPGCTYNLPKLRVRNAGNLALKYQVVVTGIKGDAKLLEVIDFELPTATNNYKGLAAGASDEFVISGTMDKDAGNEYQGLTIDNIALTVYATQVEAEYDSYGKDYDAMATVDSEEELLAAINGDYDLIALGNNIVLTDTLVIPTGKTLTIDLMGFSISQVKQQTAAYSMIQNKGNLTIMDTAGAGKISYTDSGNGGEYTSNTITNGGALTIISGTIENLSADIVGKNGYPYVVDNNALYDDAVLNIYGGTLNNNAYCTVRVLCNSTTNENAVNIKGGTLNSGIELQNPNTNKNKGELNISGGTIKGGSVAALYVFGSNANAWNNITASITGGKFEGKVTVTSSATLTKFISGGIFSNDPTAYLADGADVKKLDNGTWFVGEGTVVTSKTELQDALTTATDGDVINLATDIEGTLDLSQKSNTEVVIMGNGNVFNGSFTIDGGSAAIASAGIVIKDVVFDASDIQYDACIRLGAYGNNNTRYTNNVTIENCTFIGDGEKVAIKSYTGGDKNLTIKNCVATDVHSLLQIKNAANLTIEDCVVTGVRGISIGASSNVNIKNVSIEATTYGIRCEGRQVGAAITLTDCNVKAYIPVVIRQVTTAYAVTFNGTNNTYTATNAEGLWCVAAYNEYGDTDNNVLTTNDLTAVQADVTITVNDNSLDTNGIFIKR